MMVKSDLDESELCLVAGFFAFSKTKMVGSSSIQEGQPAQVGNDFQEQKKSWKFLHPEKEKKQIDNVHLATVHLVKQDSPNPTAVKQVFSQYQAFHFEKG